MEEVISWFARNLLEVSTPTDLFSKKYTDVSKENKLGYAWTVRGLEAYERLKKEEYVTNPRRLFHENMSIFEPSLEKIPLELHHKVIPVLTKIGESIQEFTSLLNFSDFSEGAFYDYVNVLPNALSQTTYYLEERCYTEHKVDKAYKDVPSHSWIASFDECGYPLKDKQDE
jgi:hypothetical protein